MNSENLYNIIYDFFYGIFSDTDLSDYASEIMGVNTTFSVWISHTFSIVSIALLFVVACLFLIWLFRVVSGLFLLRR